MTLQTIKLEKLHVSKTNVRKGSSDLTDLVDSVEAQGLLQSLLVRPEGDKFGIVCGSRRFQVAQILGLKELPCNVKELTEEQAIAASFAENKERDNLTFDEELAALRQIKELYVKEGKELKDFYDYTSKEFGMKGRAVRDMFKADKLAEKLRQAKKPTVIEKKPAKKKPKNETKKGLSKAPSDEPLVIPKLHAVEIERAFRFHEEEIPKPQRDKQLIDLSEAVAAKPQKAAKKIINGFKETPTKPVKEIVELVEAREVGISLKIYFPAKMVRKLREAAMERHIPVEELVPIAMGEWLKQVMKK